MAQSNDSLPPSSTDSGSTFDKRPNSGRFLLSPDIAREIRATASELGMSAPRFLEALYKRYCDECPIPYDVEFVSRNVLFHSLNVHVTALISAMNDLMEAQAQAELGTLDALIRTAHAAAEVAPNP